MTFRVRKIDYRRWPVTVALQECQDDGTVVETEHKFIGHFKRFDEDRLLAWRATIFGEGTDADLAERARHRTIAEDGRLQARFYAGLMQGWEEVLDADGQPKPWSVAALVELATGEDGPAVRLGLSHAILEIRFGLAAQKNVSTSPAPGPSPAAEAPTN